MYPLGKRNYAVNAEVRCRHVEADVTECYTVSLFCTGALRSHPLHREKRLAQTGQCISSLGIIQTTVSFSSVVKNHVRLLHGPWLSTLLTVKLQPRFRRDWGDTQCVL